MTFFSTMFPHLIIMHIIVIMVIIWMGEKKKFFINSNMIKDNNFDFEFMVKYANSRNVLFSHFCRLYTSSRLNSVVQWFVGFLCHLWPLSPSLQSFCKGSNCGWSY